MTHIDLFSGIGGFALAARWTGFETVVFCEKDEFCQKALKKYWSEVPIIPEIRDFDGTKWREATLLTGGFPCQPFSVAGQRRGKEDDRYLWPEMFRVIKEAKPRWIIAENVTGIIKMALGQVLSDLESIGYDFPRDHEGTPVVPVIPACGLNAPHRRYRVWIIAYCEQSGLERQKRREEKGIWNRFERPNSHASNSESIRPQGLWSERQQKSNTHGGQRLSIRKDSGDASDTTGQGLPKSQESQFEESLLYAQRGSWQIPWHEVAARFCRVDDGVPDRIHRLKALGNAIVPQIAEVIMKGIMEIEKEMK